MFVIDVHVMDVLYSISESYKHLCIEQFKFCILINLLFNVFLLQRVRMIMFFGLRNTQPMLVI